MGAFERASGVGRTRRGAIRAGSAALAAAAAGSLAERGGRDLTRAQQVSPEGSPEAPSVPPDFRVVLHVGEVQNWPFVLSNLRNLAQDWPRARIRLVSDGSAVTALQGDNALTQELAVLAAAGVEVAICPNALREHGIDRATVPAYASTDFGGVVALVLAQREGFAYVKP